MQFVLWSEKYAGPSKLLIKIKLSIWCNLLIESKLSIKKTNLSKSILDLKKLTKLEQLQPK